MSSFEFSDIKPDPTVRIVEEEFRQQFLTFCSLMCIVHNKKLNLANIFLLLLKHKRILALYMSMCEFDSRYGAMESFLQYDSTLHKSKYIKKYLNSLDKSCKNKDAKARKRNL
jgi:hypothetical protein